MVLEEEGSMFVIRKVGVTTRERKEDTPYVRGMRIKSIYLSHERKRKGREEDTLKNSPSPVKEITTS
jgi:hypothetical protein